MKKYLKPLLVALPLGLGTTAASAVEVYGTAGFLGYGLGVAQPLGPHLGVRADIATAGNRSERRTEEGIDYDAKVKLDRTNQLLDWFVMGGTFRVSTGLTFANTKLVLDASGAGGTLIVGGNNYTTTAADGFNVSVKYPSTMPYLGIGWGHNMQRDKGWRFAFDVGAAIGKPKVSVITRGQLSQAAAQADVDRETQELRDGVGAVKMLPQVMFSIGYSF